MNCRVYFDQSKLVPMTEEMQAKLRDSGGPYQSCKLPIGQESVHVRIYDREVYTEIERRNQLSDLAWSFVGYVSIRDDVSDQDMVKRMRSGEHEPESNARAVVRIEMVQSDYGSYAQALIEVTAPTWEEATTFHRDILYGRQPERPYVPVEPKDTGILAV